MQNKLEAKTTTSRRRPNKATANFGRIRRATEATGMLTSGILVVQTLLVNDNVFARARNKCTVAFLCAKKTHIIATVGVVYVRANPTSAATDVDPLLYALAMNETKRAVARTKALARFNQ